MPARILIWLLAALLAPTVVAGEPDNPSLQADASRRDDHQSESTTPATEPATTVQSDENCGCHESACACHGCTANAAGNAVKPYHVLFYANDFGDLGDCCAADHFGDLLKQIEIGQCGRLDVGGQIRLRYHYELGMKAPSRFQPVTADNFLLTRLRLFGDYQINDRWRVYAEGIYADSSGERFPPRGIDENFMDFLNGFVDFKVTDQLTVRAGRQELLYGAQRLISPLDWGNTRRTFEGLRLLHKSDDWSVDAFFTHFVPVQPGNLDEADYDRPFYGTYAVYSGLEHATMDLYYIGSENNRLRQSLHTVGSRIHGSLPCSDWLYEVEGASQFGSRGGGADQAGEGFVTVGLGRKVNLSWQPTVWFYFDYATENFNQLFPLAHKYLGFIDAVQRSNIESPNVLITMKPHKKVNLLFWYYHFQSNSAAAVPAIGGTPAQNAGRHLGDELDIIAKYTFSTRGNILFGYSHFWRGSKITAPQDADFFYTQLQLDF